MKFCIFGLGAVGGLIGGRLALAGFEVNAVARGATLEAVRQGGLKLDCNGHIDVATINVSDSTEALGPQDVIFITVKNTAIASVAQSVAPLLHPGTVVVSAMNGIPWWFYHGLPARAAEQPRIDAVDPAGKVTGAIAVERVLGCVTNLSSCTPEPGVVRHLPSPKFTLGEPTGGAVSHRCQSIFSAMEAARLEVHTADLIQQAIWFKLWGNMTVNPISGITGATGDKIVADPLVRDFMTRCMHEAQDVGSRIGVRIDSTPEARFEATAKLGAFRTSMLQDVEAGRSTELDALLGAVREIAKHQAIDTPNLDALFGLARLHGRTRGLYPA